MRILKNFAECDFDDEPRTGRTFSVCPSSDRGDEVATKRNIMKILETKRKLFRSIVKLFELAGGKTQKTGIRG